MNIKVQKTEAEWKAELNEEVFHILRQKGTERPYSGEYNNHCEKGTYHCAGCEALLFKSNQKFDSHCGWPAFDAPAEKTIVQEHQDRSFGMVRTEVTCKDCGGH